MGVGQGAVEGLGVSEAPSIGPSGAASGFCSPATPASRAAGRAIWLHRAGREVTGLALPPDTDPSLFRARRRRRAHAGRFRRPARSRRPSSATVRETQPADRAAHGRAAARAPLDRRAGRDLRDQCDGHGASAGGAARRRRLCRPILVVTSDKVYANAENGRRLRRGRCARRQGSLFGLEGGRRDRRRILRAELFRQARRAGRHRRAAATSSAAATSRATGSCPTSSAPCARPATLVLRHPEATRPWQHVLDCVAGYLAYAQALAHRARRAARAEFRARSGAAPVTVGELAEPMRRGPRRASRLASSSRCPAPSRCRRWRSTPLARTVSGLSRPARRPGRDPWPRPTGISRDRGRRHARLHARPDRATIEG